MSEPVSLLVTGFDSPEGPCFDTAGNLYFVNWLSSSIMQRTPAGELSEYFNTGGIPAGLAFHADGSLYVADEGDDIHGILRIAGGEGEIVVNSYQGQPLNGANDLVFDRNGVLYFSDPWRSSAANPVGGFYRLFPDGTLEQIDTGLQFPNGVAISPGGDAVYLAETIPNRILRYAIAPDGAPGPREHWADMPRVSFPGAGDADDDLPTGGPDGMAFDEAGNLYVAYYGGGRVVIFARDGSLVGEILVPGANVTNIAFGGPNRRTAIITDVATASVYTAPVATPGLRLFSGV
ncbi:MAG: SMP-30/gluconolactonase/LRE family protein [Chloroflexota bacterium]|nr:SMP-30/gluconolactonase/LRE family protein [Chloroflexota bacterium]